MKQRKKNIITRFGALIFALVAVLGLFFILITYNVIRHYYDAGTQLLNKDMASHIAKFSSPYRGQGFDEKQADSVFYNAMVLNPSSEVYFLDSTGRIIAYHKDEIPLVRNIIPTDYIQKYINDHGEKYITGPDPRDESGKKIFSAASVETSGGQPGYIYVILNSKRSAGIMELLLGNHILNLAVLSFLAVIALSLILSLLYLGKVSRNYKKFLAVLDKFESGDYTARFPGDSKAELAPVMQVFNRMADLLSSSIDKLQHSGQDRKNFIAAISHDLRSPLTIARGYAETLAFNSQPTASALEKTQQAGLIHSKLLQAENMVKQLFELSRMDAVAYADAKEPLVLAEILQESVNTFQMQAAERNIALECTKCLYHVWIEADISMMERAAQNLIENALKGTPDGGKIAAWLEVKAENLIAVIENGGAPLSDELASWINGPEEELSLPGNRPLPAGLGLLIVKRILRLHNSSLQYTVRDNKNVFSFSLPVFNKV